MKKWLFVSIAIALVLFALFVPLGSFKDYGGCPTVNMPTIRLHLIKGQSLQKKKNLLSQPEPVGAGCRMDAKYVQYLF